MRKILITTQQDFVAPRFDLATELLIAIVKDGEIIDKPKTIIMERPSDEELCQIIIGEHVTEIVCGGLDEVHYNFLLWKKIKVFDSVIGDWETVLEKAIDKTIESHTVIFAKDDKQLSL